MFLIKLYTVEPLLRGHPDKRPSQLERPPDNVNLNINVLISTPDEGTFLMPKGFHCKQFRVSFCLVYVKVMTSPGYHGT